MTVKEGLHFWDKPQKETAAGERKRHLVIFNPEGKEEVHLNAAFSIQGGNVKSLSNKYVKVPTKFKKNVEVSVGKINLSAVIKLRVINLHLLGCLISMMINQL